ncbi:MAG: hypothetical protein PHW69_00855 [Elusimicrobiaceae bacterium]|nr:hypothetical protein [Elusimicrobiaceae bacterium]
MAFTAGCGGEFAQPRSMTQADATRLISRTPGTYELYSWKTGEAWDFILVSGTSRLSSFDEIIATYKSITGVDGFLQVLDALPRGTTIFWNLREIEGFAFPDGDVLQRIEDAADGRSINLQAIQRL